MNSHALRIGDRKSTRAAILILERWATLEEFGAPIEEETVQAKEATDADRQRTD